MKQGCLRLSQLVVEGQLVLKTIYKYYLQASVEGQLIAVMECVLKEGVLMVDGWVDVDHDGI